MVFYYDILSLKKYHNTEDFQNEKKMISRKILRVIAWYYYQNIWVEKKRISGLISHHPLEGSFCWY